MTYFYTPQNLFIEFLQVYVICSILHFSAPQLAQQSSTGNQCLHREAQCCAPYCTRFYYRAMPYILPIMQVCPQVANKVFFGLFILTLTLMLSFTTCKIFKHMIAGPKVKLTYWTHLVSFRSLLWEVFTAR